MILEAIDGDRVRDDDPLDVGTFEDADGFARKDAVGGDV